MQCGGVRSYQIGKTVLVHAKILQTQRGFVSGLSLTIIVGEGANSIMWHVFLSSYYQRKIHYRREKTRIVDFLRGKLAI